MINPQWLGLFYCASDVFISARMRSGHTSSGGESKDRGSLKWIWTVVMVSVGLSIACSHLRWAQIREDEFTYKLGIVLLFAFIALRWYAIYYLGTFFTVDVAVANDHRVIDTGPYRWIRHPSYLGAIGAFTGLGLCINNWLSLVVLVVPITAVFVKRINVEEAALQAALGDAYKQYMEKTYRLLPGLY